MPQIVPLLFPKFRPNGGDGSISHELIGPLVLVFVKVGVTGTIGVCLVPEISA